MLSEFVQWGVKTGSAQQIGDWTITPQSQVFSLRFPFGGFVWNWPLAVLAKRNGRSTQHEIIDPTRIALFAFTIISTAIILGSLILRRIRRS